MTTPPPAPTLPPDLVAKAAEAIEEIASMPGWEHSSGWLAEAALRAVDVPGLMAALFACEDALDDIINCMGGDECSGWDAPEDVWELAQKGRTIARRVLGKEAEA